MCPFPFFVTMLIPYLCQTIEKHDTMSTQCATFIEREKEERQTNREREREREGERERSTHTVQ